MYVTIGIVVGAVLLVGIIIFNTLVGRRNNVKNAFSSVDALLKKRYDLIPNLVATVKNYAQHEQQTLTQITELRARAMSGQLSQNETVDLNNKLGGLLAGLRVSLEAYPDLKANQNYLQLQAALNEVEEQISAGRRAYNATVKAYNNSVEMFPTSLVAGLGGFEPAIFFEVEASERAAPAVDSLFKR